MLMRLLPVMPLLLLAAALLGQPSAAQHPFVFKHSFQGPFAGNNIPFWNLGSGASVEGTDRIRITPARQSRTGFVWNTVPSQLVAWEVTLQLQVAGQPRYGGDGLAFWYVERPEVLGKVYGSADPWSGLMIAFDTFNNDQRGSNPLITAVFNDGTMRFDHDSDGETQALGSCSQEIRNLAEPSFARITYQDARLTVELATTSHVDPSGIRVPGQFQQCISVDNVELGADKFFGVTAQTGDVADSHDVLSLVTRDLGTQTSLSLDTVRQRYTERLRESQARAQTQAVALSQEDFQRQVLSLLGQLQGAQSVIEQSQIAIGDLLSRMATDSTQAAAAAAGQQQQHGQQPGSGSMMASSGGADIPAIRNELNRLREEVFQRLQNNLRAEDSTARSSKAELLQAIRQISTDLSNQATAAAGSGFGGWMSFVLLLLTCVGVLYGNWKQYSAARNERFKKFLD